MKPCSGAAGSPHAWRPASAAAGSHLFTGLFSRNFIRRLPCRGVLFNLHGVLFVSFTATARSETAGWTGVASAGPSRCPVGDVSAAVQCGSGSDTPRSSSHSGPPVLSECGVWLGI